MRVPNIAERWNALSRWPRIAIIAVLVALLYMLPIIEPPLLTTTGTDFGGVLFTMAIYCLVALGLNIVVGYAGLLDLGYVGFYAVGAYTVGVLASEHESWPFLLTIPAAVGVAMVSGLILGWPTLRVRGDYLAIVTLGFGEIIRIVAQNTEWLGAARGITKIPGPPDVPIAEIPHLAWEGLVPLVDLDNTTHLAVFGVLDSVPYYWFALTMIFVILLGDRLIKDSRVGRAWEATREDEDAAELMGVPTFRFKLLAFMMGAFVGGLSGALFAGKQGFINPTSFQILLSILFLAAVMLGGAGNRWGVLVGAALVVYLPERFRVLEDWRVLVFGAVLILLAAYRPQGLFPAKRTRRVKRIEEKLEAMEEGEPA